METEILTTETQIGGTTNAKEYEIEYLGEKEKVSLNFDNDDEVKQILQKAKNNDRLAEKWESSKGKLSKVEEISRKLGYIDKDGHGDIDAMVEATVGNLTASEINRIAQEQSPDEIAQELYNTKKENEELKAIKSEVETERQKARDYQEFMATFERLNGKKFDDRVDLVPLEVWQEVSNGTPLKYAYSEHFANQVAKAQAIAQKNLENKETSTGNVVTSGGNTPTTFTREDVKSMSRDEVSKNFEAIAKSMKKWIK